jgi:signal transduction histidine kinase
VYIASDQQLLLAARPPSRTQRVVAYCAMACLLAIVCIAAPYARVQLPAVPQFIAVYATIFVFTELITAFLILAQFWVVRWTWLLVLASGFLFTALMAVPGALAFPGVFSPTGLLGAGAQSAAWIGALYHLGSPAALIAAVLVRGRRQKTGTVQRSPQLAIALSIALVIVIASSLTWAVLAYDQILPRIFANNVQQSRNMVLVIVPIMALQAIAFLLLLRRGRSVLDLWLMVVCCAWLLELSLGTLFAGARYNLGWYAARTFQLVATVIVLVLLLSETTALYASMARESIRRRDARYSRQIAMDAMAASIGHEIKQPLTAILANAGAGERLAAMAEPDMKEVQAIFSDIAAEGERMGKIISDVRMMFQKGTHERKLLDINNVIRDALATVEPDLHAQRVTVKTEMDDDLPPVLGNDGQLHQLFLNLIANALEAMSAVAGRSAVLMVRTFATAGFSDIAVTVEDTGVGIADTDSDRIFEPFFSTKAAGTGVGLTICRVIVEAHGGKLEVCTNKPSGTIFRVILPEGGED